MATTGPLDSLENRDASGARTVRLFTPERVPLVIPLAGIGERALAYGIDLTIVGGVVLAAAFVFNFFGDLGTLAFTTKALFAVGALGFALFYDVLFETRADGRTPGKRAMRLRVVTSDGERPDVMTSTLRNVFRLIDFLPGGYGLGSIALFLTGSKRLGDMVAGTSVILERAIVDDALMVLRSLASSESDQAPLARPLDAEDAEHLLALVRATRHLDKHARARRIAAGARARGLVEKGSDDDGTADFDMKTTAAVALALLARAEQGLGLLGELSRLDEAARALDDALKTYREKPSVASVDVLDTAIRAAGSALMRASLREIPSVHLSRLSLSLLDAERLRRSLGRSSWDLVRLLSERMPQSIYRERALVARAAVVLFGAAAAGFGLALADDQVARALLGDDVAAAIDGGARWTDRIEREDAFLTTALMVTVNNVRVGFLAFTAGLFGGVGTVLVLVMNGLHLGAVFGFAARLDSAGTLARFILAHGPVELTSICLAGAAGFVLGRAILRPGDRRRRDALTAESKTAGHLLLGATIGFMVIGSVEGFISPGAVFSAFGNAALGFLLLGVFVGLVVVYGGRVRALPSRDR